MSSTKLNNTAILILGMHRSGTSAVAGCLSRMGVYLGKNLMPAMNYNPKGLYEHTGILHLHRQLLWVLGSDWDDPRPMPKGWVKYLPIIPFRRRLKSILLDEFAGIPLWGIKEPRMCRLLPLWLPLLTELEVDVKVLFVLRDPAEIAASLASRNNMPEKRSLALWLKHVLPAELATRGLSRSVLMYEDLLNDWRAELLRLQDIFELPSLNMSAEAETQIDTFITPGLRRHKKNQLLETSEPEKTLTEDAYAIFSDWRHKGIDPVVALDEISHTMNTHFTSAQIPASWQPADGYIPDNRILSAAVKIIDGIWRIFGVHRGNVEL